MGYLRPDWRLLALAGLAAGLALSPFAAAQVDRATEVALVLGCLALALLRPAAPGQSRGAWASLLVLAALVVGVLLGTARLDAIDGGALHGSAGDDIDLRGYVVAVPRRSDGQVRVAVEGEDGRVLVEAHEPVADLRLGAEVEASGELAVPPPWYRSTLERQGIALMLKTGGIDLTGGRRGGFSGRLDLLRNRAEDALGRGMPEREAALARGFVLGQDDSIDPVTVEDFRRSGLSHLLAVSGQNVVLLMLLAGPLLGLLGVPLRARLFYLLGIVAIYIPIAGGGPSIQRAGVMGAAALVATMSGRPSSRVFALLAAAAVTLALNPRATGDPGWQLSFAAVVGIFLIARPLRDALAMRLGEGAFSRAVAEGGALTIAATLATAPLIATHFGTFSVASLVANILVLPAVAPAMWLGMITAALAQIPFAPVEWLNAVNALLLGYIAQVAAWCGRPSWASVDLGEPRPGVLAAAYAALALVALAVMRGGARMRVTRAGSWRLRRSADESRSRAPRRALLVVLAACAAISALILLAPVSGQTPPGGGLRITVLDVGQGDAILLQPAHAEAILVDGGPPGDGIAADLRAAGVDSLGAAVVTHDESDHAGGIADLLGTFPIHRVVYGFVTRRLLNQVRRSGAGMERVGEGSELRSGGLRLEVLWPPRVLLSGPVTANRNEDALVLLARWGRFSMLLTADAEAEVVPMDPGPIDVLKVAHHGSVDAGLGELLDRSAPSLAVISVGAGNSYGHPTEPILDTLAEHRVPVMRTDEDGSVVIDVDRDGFEVEGAG